MDRDEREHVRALCRAVELAEGTVAALRDRIGELEAIIAGRTTPPTDAEIEAHWRAGGTWVVGGAIVLRSVSDARRHRAQSSWARVRWLALDGDGHPCARPAVPLTGGA